MKINIKEFTGKCSCQRDHQLVVDDVILEEGALKKLPEILKKDSIYLSSNSSQRGWICIHSCGNVMVWF